MANNLNRCEFIGRLGGAPEVRYTTGGDAVASFSIAVGESWKDKAGEKQERTEWVNITAWGRLTEICGEYLHKGSKVYISGKMKTEKYQKDGQDRYITKIVMDQMEMLDSKPSGEGQQAAPARSAPPARSVPARQAPASRPAPAAGKKFDDDFDSDIPF